MQSFVQMLLLQFVRPKKKPPEVFFRGLSLRSAPLEDLDSLPAPIACKTSQGDGDDGG